jgi:hypothetical protein
MNESVLVTLAMLNVNWDDAGTSYIHNFIPFVADSLRDRGAEVVSTPELQADLAERFGIDLPQPAIQGIVNRAARDGLLVREHGVLRPVPDRIAEFDLGPRRRDVLRQHEAAVDKLQAFAGRSGRDAWERPAAEEALLSFLAERSLPVLRAIVRGRTFEPELFVNSEAEYLVSAFIADAFERDPETFGYIETVVKGTMLAAALYLPNAGQPTRRITDLDIYLDTPFLLRALGWDEPATVAAAEELMKLLRSIGARLACFDHTAEEVRNVLASCVRNLSQARRGRERPIQMPIVEFCLANGIGPSDVDRRSEKLEQDLRRLGITVMDPPPYEVSTTVDETLLEETLQDCVHYQRDETRLFDLKSLTAINRLRNGRSFRNLEDAKAIFTTPNFNLVLASRRFFRERPDGSRVPVCTVDHELATVAWLRSPVTTPDLPSKQILADAYAAMYPDERLWSRYLDEIDRLEGDATLSEDDYYVLRFSVEARRALMQETLGQEQVFTTGTVTEVLRRAHENKQAELMSHLRSTNAVLEEVQGTLAAEAQRADAAEQTAADVAERSAQKLRDQKSTDRLRRQVLADRYAHRAARSLYWSLVVLTTLAVVASLPSPMPAWLGAPVWIPVGIVWLVLLAMGALSVANLAESVSLNGLSQRFEGWLASRILRYLDRNLG